jgi:long-subunit fatty acid transport protein
VQAQAGFNTFQFSFSNPGARSMGFGGAFVALADDATAAYANPAGLVQIIEPEVSLEGRSWSYSTPYTSGGRLDGEPSGFGLDSVAGLRTRESRQSVAGLSFLSVVYPKGSWSFAFYRHVLSNFEFGGETQGLFANPFPPDTGFRRENDRRSHTEYDIVGSGVTAAWRASDTLSVGVGVVYFDVGLSGTEERFSFDSLGRFFERNSYLPERNTENILFSLDDSDWAFIAGFLWSPTAHWRLGGAYRQGPEVRDFTVEVRSGPADLSLPPHTLFDRVVSPLAFPDTYSLGVAYRAPGDRVTLTMEWDRVEYSTIIESINFSNDVVIDDADELRIGAEFVILNRRPVIALRGGAWLDPDHRLRFEGNEPELDRAFFRRGTDELHWSAGVGVVFQRFQLDFGVDVSDLVNTFSVSTIYGF